MISRSSVSQRRSRLNQHDRAIPVARFPVIVPAKDENSLEFRARFRRANFDEIPKLVEMPWTTARNVRQNCRIIILRVEFVIDGRARATPENSSRVRQRPRTYPVHAAFRARRIHFGKAWHPCHGWAGLLFLSLCHRTLTRAFSERYDNESDNELRDEATLTEQSDCFLRGTERNARNESSSEYDQSAIK